jgi:ribonuclease Z
MIIVPLGVASATPTVTRHLPSVALWREGSVCLFDCGENTQMRMLQAGLKRSKIDYIFISHFDLDHFSGLIGLMATLQLQRREKPLHLVGPKGLKEYVEFNFKFAAVELTYDVIYTDIDEKKDHQVVVDNDAFYVEARPLKHNVFCVGYRFQEKDKPGKVDAEKAAKMGITEDQHFKDLKAGKDVKLDDGTVVQSSDIVGHPRPGDSFAYITDTQYCPNAVKLAMNTNILYHEATFGENLQDKAEETGHSTASDAARVATEAQTKLLVIGHFSARYTNPFVLLREARANFFPTWLASELRPIYTDPAHEKGIVEAKVYIKEIDDSSGKDDYRGRKSSGSFDKSKNFRSRKKYGDRDSRGGGYRSRDDNRGGSSGYRSRDDRGGSGYRSRDDNRGSTGGYRSRDDNRSSTGGSSYRSRDDNRSGGGGYQRRDDNRTGTGGSSYRSRDDRGSTGYQRKPVERDDSREKKDKDEVRPSRHITPRTPYDDFDRF